MVKSLSTMRETRLDPWVRKIPWRRKWQSTPVLLPGKSHGWRNLVGYSPWGRQESGTTERLHSTQLINNVVIVSDEKGPSHLKRLLTFSPNVVLPAVLQKREGVVEENIKFGSDILTILLVVTFGLILNGNKPCNFIVGPCHWGGTCRQT